MTQLYPAVLDPKTLSRQVWDVSTARQIPGVGRALGIITGLMSQMALDLYRGIVPLPRPALLDNPSPDQVLPLFIRLQVEDYLTHGNACHLVTARYSRGDQTGWPAACRWFPAHAWHVLTDADDGRRRYFLHGKEVSRHDVVHVQNGADPLNPSRGMGVVEQYVRTFDRIALQEESERETLYGGAVPSVAVILPPDDDSSEEELDDAADSWVERFGGGSRKPGFLPHGTTVTPLAWNPREQDAVEARQMGLQDVANAFNLDGYWLGAKQSSHTYRSPGPLFLALLRTTLEPHLAMFEATWSLRWVPRGQRVRFDRESVLGDDFATTVKSLTVATGGPIMTPDEGRARIALGPVEGGDVMRAAASTTMDVEPDPEPDDDQQGDEEA